MRVSVHITSKDRASELAMCLQSLLFQTFKDFDVMILDDGYGTPIVSSFPFLQGVINRLRCEGHGVRLLRNPVSFGVCKARQLLLDKDLWPENELVLRVDDDQVLSPDYLERLVGVMEDYEDAGIVSGITPLLNGPDFVRELSFVGSVINKIELDDKGVLVKYCDDCGMLYDDIDVLPAHQFRSSALIRRKVFDKVKYELGLSDTGFREEAYLSLRSLMDGWKIYVDTGAVAWHNPCNSGGCRAQDYAQRVQLDEELFRKFLVKYKDKLREVLV